MRRRPPFRRPTPSATTDGMRWTIPNTLTTMRLLAALGVPVMFLYFHRPTADWFALALFVSAAITDYFDGYLARLWKQESKFGTMLDPIADKAMVVIALLILTGYSGMNPWLILPASVILFREVFVGGLREFLGAKAGLLKVTRLAKWKTTAQMVAIPFLLFDGDLFDVIDTRLWGTGLIWISAIMTVWSMVYYLQKALPEIRKRVK